MRGAARKRSVNIAGHATSLSLEEDAGRHGNLSSALRLFVLDCYRRGELGPAAPLRDEAPDP